MGDGRSRALAALTALIAALAIAPPAMAAPSTTRERAEQLFEQAELDTAVPTGWTGSVRGCKVGSESPDSIAATFRTINAVRELAGIPTVEEDPEMSAKALAAALVFEAAGTIEHEIDQSWECWTHDAEDGAAHSNLSGLGDTGPERILSYVNEGPDFGHRLNLMNPGLFTMGTGSSRSWNANYVIGGELGGERYDEMAPGSTVAWPAPGPFPAEWLPQHWSIALGNADTQETISVRNAQVNVEVDGESRKVSISKDDRGMSANVYGIGQPLGWTVALPADISSGDHRIDVEISGVKMGGESFPIAYSIDSFGSADTEPPDPDPSAECLAAKSKLSRAKANLARARRGGKPAKVRRAREGVARAQVGVRENC